MPELMEELEIVPATRSPHGFLASPLSENISVRDDGSLIIVGCPIARTGWQKYAVKDLPQQRAKDLGVDVSNPEASIDLYRPASEVFHPEFLASLNGVTITDGHPPGGEFVDPNNFKKYACGHIENVRKGTEPLEDGEWPIIADLIVSAEPLIGKVRNKTARELSLGYDFSIDREGGKITQCGMMGNHCAVVPDGRAGDFVRIEDAAPPASVIEQVLPAASGQANPKEPEPAKAEVIEAVAYPPIKLSFKSDKEKQPVSTKNKLLRLFMGKHLIELARATDADPEKIMEAAEALQETPPEAADDKRGKDGEVPPALKEHEFKKSDDRRSKDEESEPAMSEDRKAAHDALDRIMDKRGKGKDSDVASLKELLDEFLEEEEEEPEHAEDRRSKDRRSRDEDDVDTDLLEEELAEDDLCPECGEAHDAEEECPGEELVESGEEVMDEEGESPDPDSDDDQEDVEPAEDRRRRAADRRARATDGAAAVLRALRPAIARTDDKVVQSAFNRALDSVKKVSRTSTGSYGGFAASARARDKAPRNPNPDRARAGDAGKADPIVKLQEFYNSARGKGGK